MKIIMCFFIFLSSIFVNKNVNSSNSQYINKSYIVINASNNQMIEGKDVHLVRSVASVSKIMTAIVAIEKGDLNKEVVIEKQDIDTYGSSLYLKEGDKITLLDLLYGLMLRSGNDAALTIARVVGGSVENFASLMNDKAIEIGMNNSSFTNPSGLDVNEMGNLSTSYDLALLMSYAIKNELFLKISGTKQYSGYTGVWVNKNKLLNIYDKTIAGKTGFTYKAKRTLVTAAKDGDTIFVVVSLDCGNDFNFHKYLYEKNFAEYRTIKVLEKGENVINDYQVSCENAILVTIKDENVENYSLVYHIKGNKGKIYIKTSENTLKIGECEVKKTEKSLEKQGWWGKLKRIFSK